MHIPDGFIPLWQCALYGAIALLFIIVAFIRGQKSLNEKNIPLMAVLAAGLFAIMTINFPIPGGSSGHMVGAAMVAIIFMSPWAAIIVITLVLAVQAIFFGDGGVTTLGANIINMGICGGFVGYYTFKGLYRPHRGSNGVLTGSGILSKYWAIGVASWLAIFLSACLAAIEIWWAGYFPLTSGLIYMGGVHAVIGIVEAIITVIVISSLEKIRPDLLTWNNLKRSQPDTAESDSVEVPQ
jgi:cobalt/nickel transport system permease protein